MRVRLSTTWILTDTMLLAPVASNAEQEGELTVSATYKGKGVVDDTHEISVFLFDYPNPTTESTPMMMQVITKNGASATYKGWSQRISPPRPTVASCQDEAPLDTGTPGA